MTSQKSPPKRSFYRFDPIATLLIKRFHLTSVGFGLLSIPILSLFYLLIAWISNTLWTQGEQVGLLQDWFPWFWILLINPVVLGYYLWSFQAISGVIEDLEESDVVMTQQAEIDAIVLNPYYQKLHKYIALGCAIAYSIFVFISQPSLKNNWYGAGVLPNLAVTIATFVGVYIGSMLVLTLVTNIRILHRIFEEKDLNINPLHPDRCGGLHSLSNYSLKTAYLAAVLGIMVGLIEYQFVTQGVAKVYWFVHLIIPIHIILSTACFYSPLLAAHRGMKKAKEELLHKIARQFHADYSQIHESLAGDAETLKQGTEKIQGLRDFYKFTDEFPVWPFDVQTFRQFLLTVPAPLLPIFLGLLQEAAGMLLKNLGINFG
jgi:hypothetical protein